MIVYKYQDAKTVLTHILGRSTLRFSPPNVLNDPFECGPNPGKAFLNAVRPEVQTLVNVVKGPGLDLDLAERLVTEKLMRVTFQKAFGSVAGILSMSKRPDDLLMWAQYAGNHAGFVLGFDAENSFFSPDGGVSRDGLRDVQYKDDRPEVPLTPLGTTSLEGALDMREVTDAFFFIKSSHWTHEQEVRAIRLINTVGSMPGVVPFPSDALREIIIGARTNEDDLEQAFDHRDARFPQAEMKVAVLSTRTYSMTVEPAPPKLFMKLARRSK